jgi:UPF0755 protein
MSRFRMGGMLLLMLAACGAPAGPGTSERVVVPPGASFNQVTDSLAAHRIIRSRLWFKLVARVKGVDRAVRAGAYEFPRDASASAVLATLAAGRTAAERLTIPEGLTVSQIGALAGQKLGLSPDSIVAAARDTTLIDSLGFASPSLEGFLRPETYLVPSDISARELVGLMARGFAESWKPAWNARLDTLGLTRLQLVPLASIVEGEARVDSERETIAGVYHNRLRIRMPLQADPTVQYAIELETGRRKPRLFEKDYQTKSPYNTYLYPGLPPGPVNSPSRRSIEASLYPASVPFLYFVARPDGHHVFSRTYDEHLRNVAQTRRMRTAQAR